NAALAVQGGTVTGSGSIASITNTSGTVAPGVTTPAPTIGAFTLIGGGVYTQGLSGAFSVKLGGTAAGQFDRLSTPVSVSLNGTLNATLINGYTPALGDSITIISANAVSGTFATTNLPALSSGLGWKVTYNSNSVVLSVVSVASPVVTLGASSISFPNTIVNQSSAVKKVSLQNTGTKPLTITSIQPTGPDAGNYSYVTDGTNPCPISTATLTSQVTWNSTNTGAATISSTGLATAVDVGSTNITASFSGVTSNTFALTVTNPTLQSIAVTPANPSIAKGSTQQFTATGTYSDNSTQNVTSQVTWASGTTSVATITTAGLATAVATGTSTISATLGAVNGSTVLTVTPAALQSIAVTPANPSIAKGTTQQFTATGTYTDNSTQNVTSQVTWASGTTSVATITTAG